MSICSTKNDKLCKHRHSHTSLCILLDPLTHAWLQIHVPTISSHQRNDICDTYTIITTLFIYKFNVFIHLQFHPLCVCMCSCVYIYAGAYVWTYIHVQGHTKVHLCLMGHKVKDILCDGVSFLHTLAQKKKKSFLQIFRSKFVVAWLEATKWSSSLKKKKAGSCSPQNQDNESHYLPITMATLWYNVHVC